MSGQHGKPVIGLDRKMLRKFPRTLAGIVVELVNNYDVRFRLQKDGNHLFLYADPPGGGGGGLRPFKIAAKREEQVSLHYLAEWVADNVPKYVEDKVGETEHKAYYCSGGCVGVTFSTREEVEEHLREVHDVVACEWCPRKLSDCVEEPCAERRLANDTARCTCGTGGLDYAGPQIDCPVHGCWEAPPECECAMTESSMRSCPQHGEEARCEVCSVPWADHPEAVEPPEPVANESDEAARQVEAEGMVRRDEVQERIDAQGMELPEWSPYLYSTGRVSEVFEVHREGHALRCIRCSYTREGGFTGVHMHEAGHTGEAALNSTRNAERRRIKNAARSAEVQVAMNEIAVDYGLVVVTEEMAEHLDEVEMLRQANADLGTLVDDLQAQLALIREALGLTE